MKRLQLIRHAHARGDSPTGQDLHRPLSTQGLSWAAELANRLSGAEHRADLWLVSTATRTRETAEVVRATLVDPSEIRFLDELYLAEPATILTCVAREAADVDAVTVVAHNPGIEILAAVLTQKQQLFFTPGSSLTATFDTDSWEGLLDQAPIATDLLLSS